MKKILYVTTVSSTINVFLVSHIKMLIDKGNKVDIACNIDQELSNDFMEYGVILHRIDFSRNPLSLDNKKAYKQIKELQQREKFDIVHVHTPVASFVTRLALRNENIKMIYTCHGFHFYKGAPLINWMIYYPLEKIAAHWTDVLVTINSEDLNRADKFNLRNNGQVKLMHGVGIDPKIYELDNFDRDEYRKKLGLDKEDFVLLVLAELNQNKNHIQVIKAIDILKNKYPNIKALFAGKGSLENKLNETISNMGLEENIKLIGFRSDIKELLHSCDCVGLFSKREGLGKCLLEGMITGKPIIATNTRGPKELIDNNKNGFILSVNDYIGTCNCIEQLYVEDKKSIDFGKISKEKVKKYLLNNVLDEVYKIHSLDIK